MKAIKLIVISLVCMFAFASCDQDKIITGITYAKQDKELFSTKYNVRLDNGLEIEFDGDGVPVDIDTDN